MKNPLKASREQLRSENQLTNTQRSSKELTLVSGKIGAVWSAFIYANIFYSREGDKQVNAKFQIN